MDAPDFPPVAGGGSPAGRVLHLDTWVWVRLASAADYWPTIRDALRSASHTGSVTIALTATNYLELWHRQKRSSRNKVAEVMADLSQYHSLREVSEVQSAEAIEVLNDWQNVKRRSALQPREWVVGVGARHAFSSPTGRFRFIESLATETEQEGDAVDPPRDLVDLFASLPAEQWEWINLSGFDDGYDIPGIEFRPEHRLGNQYVAEIERVRALSAQLADASVLYRTLIAKRLNEMADWIAAGWTDSEVSARFTGPLAGVTFANSVPTAAVRTALEYQAARNSAYRFRQHDRSDIYNLALAIPYADGVWADAHWTQMAISARLDAEYGTTIFRKPADLMRWLDA